MQYSQEELDNMLQKYTGLPDLDTSDKRKKTLRNKREHVVLNKDDGDLISNDEIKIIKEQKTISVPIISLISWVKRYGNLLPDDIKTIDLRISGVSKDEYLLVKVPHPKGGELSTGVEKKELLMFKNANKIPVLDLPINSISMYSSGIKMIHTFNGGFIKCYTGKSNYLIASITNNRFIPYYMTKVKNTNSLIYKECKMIDDEIYNEMADKERIKTLYNVILKEKSWPTMRTNNDIFNYFLNIQKNIKDNSHHIKIDNIMIGMLTGDYPEDKNIATHVSYQLIYN